jgi:hypothetical protein
MSTRISQLNLWMRDMRTNIYIFLLGWSCLKFVGFSPFKLNYYIYLVGIVGKNSRFQIRGWLSNCSIILEVIRGFSQYSILHFITSYLNQFEAPWDSIFEIQLRISVMDNHDHQNHCTFYEHSTL